MYVRTPNSKIFQFNKTGSSAHLIAFEQTCFSSKKKKKEIPQILNFLFYLLVILQKLIKLSSSSYMLDGYQCWYLRILRLVPI